MKRNTENVIQATESYQRLLNIASRADAEEGIRQGLEDANKGNIRPAMEFFDEFENEYGILRIDSTFSSRRIKP